MNSNDRSEAGATPVVVGIAFDDSSETAFRYAVELASLRPGTELHLVHVIAKPRTATNRTRSLEKESAQLEETPKRLRSFVRSRLEAYPALRNLQVVLHSRVGNVAAAIVQLTADVNAGVIVVGTRQRRGVKKLILGSVAKELIQVAHCPVVVAKPRDYEGVERSPSIEPVCPDCAAIRDETNGEQMWCERHATHRARPHAVRYREVFAVGGHDPGIVP